MHRPPTTVAIGIVAASIIGCYGEEPEPVQLSATGSFATDENLQLDCALPLSAVGAELEYSFVATGTTAGFDYLYTSSNLPPGLVLEENSGSLAGAVNAAGTYHFLVTVTNRFAEESSHETLCSLIVRERLAANLSFLAEPFCLHKGDDLRDLIIEGTGDGTGITCGFIPGLGNGKMPTGVDVDEQSCTVVGNVEEDRFGTWVFVVRASQSNVSVYVPYCISNTGPQSYDMSVFQGQSEVDILLPISHYYDPLEPVSIGEPMNPRYLIEDPANCGGECDYHWYEWKSSVVSGDIQKFELEPTGYVENKRGIRTGFYHELRMDGSGFPSDRPWLASIQADYCLAQTEADCPDANTRFEFGVIMIPN